MRESDWPGPWHDTGNDGVRVGDASRRAAREEAGRQRQADDWKVGYRQALLRYVAKNGTPVQPGGGSLYGWIANDWEKTLRHVRDCGLDYAHVEIIETAWDEFGGTFASHDYHKHGIDAKGRCKCGKMRDLHLRVDRGVGEILLALLKED